MLEGQELMEADTPDFDAMESRIEKVAEVKVELAKLRLSIHKEIRPLLDDDQKVLFDRGLGRMLLGGMAGDRAGHPGMMGRSGMRSGIPSEDWESVVTLYGSDAHDLVAFTGNERGRNIRVLLVDSEGVVRWFHDRGFSAGKLLELEQAAINLKAASNG